MKTAQDKVRIKYAINEKRALYEKLRQLSAKNTKENKKNGKQYDSEVIRLMSQQLKSTPKRRKNMVTIIMPPCFSCLDNPEEAIRHIFNSTSEIIRAKDIKNIHIDYSQVKTFDLAAETLFDYIMYEIKLMYPKLHMSGIYPSDMIVQRFIRSVGIIKELDIKHEILPDSEMEKIEIFKEGSRTRVITSGGVARTYKDEVTQKFAKHLDNCLQRVNKKLSYNGKSKICQYVSEVLDNISEHAGFDKWRIIGYLDTENQNMTCEVAILNFGNTINDTFKRLGNSSSQRRGLEKYINKHKDRFNDEILTTIYSLQGDVSSKNTSEDSSRGQGTVELLLFFQELQDSLLKASSESFSPKMVIVSGRTCLIFNKNLNLIKYGGTYRIPLNDEGSLQYPPDPKYIKYMPKEHFPGTLISIRFILPQTLIKEISNG